MGRNTLLSDVSTVDGVTSLISGSRPQHRTDIQLRYLTYGPKELDIGYAGRFTTDHAVHAALDSLTVGSKLVLQNRMLVTMSGVTVGRLARATQNVPRSGATGLIKGIMVRTRSQTAPNFQADIRTDQWEVPLLEFVEP